MADADNGDLLVEVEAEEGMVEEAGIGILDNETMKDIVRYLIEEMESARTEREEQEKDWKKWRRQREFRPEKKQLDYPWPKSANVSVPLSGMLTQNMWAYIKSTFDVREPLISVSSYTKDPGDVEIAETLEKYIDLLAESPFDLNLRPQLETITYEAASMGVTFVKVPWTIDRWVFKTPGKEGELQTVYSTLHDGPEWVPIGREDFLYRQHVQDLQRAPWVAHHFELSEHELVNRQADGVYENVEQVLKSWRANALEHQVDQEDRMGILRQPAKIYDMYEVYLYWRMPDEDYMVDLLITFHEDSKQILRAEYNELGVRPFGSPKYVPRPFYLDGIGVGWITEHMQDEVDYHHRLRINNGHFSSMAMLAVKRGAGYSGKETIYPGKIWKVDDPSRDVVRIPGGEVQPISLQAEAFALQYGERAVGFSDAQRGFADMVAKSGTSAQLQMFNAQQGGKLINSILGGMVTDISKMAMFTVFQLVKNKERVITAEREYKRLTGEEISELEKALSIELADIPKKLKFSVRTTDLDKTFEVRRQNTLSLVQIYGMFWERIIPLLQMINHQQTPPEMKPVLTKAFTGSCNLLEKVFKFFGEDATGKYVPEYKRQEVLLEIRSELMGDLDEAKRVLEEVRDARGEGGFARAAAIGGAAGARAAAGGGFGAQGSVQPPRVETPQPGVQPVAGTGGPIA